MNDDTTVAVLKNEIAHLHQSIDALNASVSALQTEVKALTSFTDKGKGALSALLLASGIIGSAITMLVSHVLGK